MNQILMTNDKNGYFANDIKKIVKFFVIVIIVFALIFIGEGAYNLYNTLGKDNSYPQPVLSYERNGSAINLEFASEIGINRIEYYWNDGTSTIVKCNGKTNFDFEVEMLQGNNVLHVSATDIEGNKTNFDDIVLIFDTNEDNLKPEVSIVSAGGKITVSASDETELDYLLYQWEDEEEVKVSATEENKKSITQEIQVQKGTKKLTITAVDKTGNKETISKTVFASNGAKIKASIADGNFVVTVTSEVGITKIQYTINEVEHTVENIPDQAKEFEFKVPLEEGANYLKINAYENELMTEYKCKKTK